MATPISVKTTTPITPQSSGTMGSSFNDIMSFMGSNLMILIIILGVIFGIIIILYIMRKMKKYDPFLEQFMLKKNQCRMFREDNIKKVYIENQKDGLVLMGSYEGECIDKEGYHNILFSRIKFGLFGRWIRKILFFSKPLLDLLLKKHWIIRSNVNPVFKEKVINTDPNTGKKTMETKTITLPSVKIVKGNGSLILHCYGLQMKKYFTYPILQNQDGSIIQDEAINFERERDSVLTDTLYEQTIDFANVMREAINLNPSLRYVVKTEGKTLPDGGQ